MTASHKVEWEYKTLPELGSIGRGKSKHRPRNDAALYGGRYPFIQTSDIKHANFYVNSFTQTYNDAGLAQSKLWQSDTLCMTIAANIAETAILKFPACFPDSVVGFVSDPNKSNVKFVKYALDQAKREFQKSAKGTAQDNLSLEKIDCLKLNVPNVEIQSKIASIISTYDDLIEVNEKRIKILEEMAQLLYVDWFVKFRFPGYENVKMVDSETEYGMIPEGWVVKTLGDKIQIRKGKNITFDTVVSGTVPVVAGGLEPAYFHNTPNTDAPVVTISASGANAGFSKLYFEDIWASDCSFIDGKVTEYVFFFYLFLKNKKEQIKQMQRGSAQPHVYPKDLMSLNIADPTDLIISKFEGKVKPIFNLIASLKRNNLVLSKARDILIPQLVTGKKELKNI